MNADALSASADEIRRNLKETTGSTRGDFINKMKKATDPRHHVREKMTQELFSFSFQRNLTRGKNLSFSERTNSILLKLSEIDKLIGLAAPEWPVEKISKIDLAILRLAVYELLKKKEPAKVVIDEAVELAKTFGGDTSAPFVNGVLGTVYSWLQKKVDTSRPPAVVRAQIS